MNWFTRLFGDKPIHGEEAKERGYLDTTARVRAGMDEREAAHFWAHADPPQDDYDRGVIAALADGGFKDPLEMQP